MTASPAFRPTIVGGVRDGVEMKIVDGSLRIRSSRTASRYVGGRRRPRSPTMPGFVDTGDMVELRGDRYYFVGRKGGIINIGGLKVHPEEVEAVINRHPQVRMSLVRPRQSPITGAIVVADVVLKSEEQSARRATDRAQGRYPQALPRDAAAPQGAGRDQLRADARRSPRPASWCAGKAEAMAEGTRNVLVTGGSRGLGPCHRASSPAPAIASSPWRARRARR